MSPDSETNYVAIRRLLVFLEHSITQSIQWATFEPNNERSWTRVRATVDGFLLEQWRSGALKGSRADDAFFVKCDSATMTQTDVEAGRLVCVVGVAPVRPAEFVIFQIGVWTEPGCHP